MLSDSDKANLVTEFEELGIDKIQLKYAPTPGLFEPESAPFAREWVAVMRAREASESFAKRDAREERTLAIAEEANDLAREANRHAFHASLWAMCAALVAAAALIYTARDLIKPILALIIGPHSG